MDIIGAILFWCMIAGLAVIGLGGIVMCGIGTKNLRSKEHSGTDVLLIIIGAVILLAMIALIVSLIFLNMEIYTQLQQDPMYGLRV